MINKKQLTRLVLKDSGQHFSLKLSLISYLFFLFKINGEDYKSKCIVI